MSKLDQVRALREAKFVKAPKPKAAVRKPVARRVMKAVTLKGRRTAVVAHIDIPIESCPNCGGTGKRPRSMTAAERQRLRRARLKGGK